MKRQRKVYAVMFVLIVWSILSNACLASDTTKVFKTITVDVGRNPTILDSNAIVLIREASNEMFTADYVTVVYADDRDKKTADKVCFLLLAEGIPPTSVTQELAALSNYKPNGREI